MSTRKGQIISKIPRYIMRRSKSVLVWGRNRLLCSLDYNRSVKVLTSMESDAANAEQLFDVPFSYKGYGEFQSIRPKQVISEIQVLYTMVRKLEPKRIGEIGTFRGGTFYLWCKAARSEATLISIDLPGGPFGGGYSQSRISFYERFSQPGQTLHFLQADSHSEGTSRMVEEILAGNFLDFLFVDGDHTYTGVRRDFELYKPLVRQGGIVAFHDILPRHDVPEIEVHKFWGEIKPHYRCQEIIASDRPRIGIGVIWID